MSTPTSSAALLPAGFADLLPNEAELEARTVERLIERVQACGYERVKPPLLEFEEGLLSGTGEAMVENTFRLMDPVSRRMMGLRADMTPQMSRIASHRLPERPRPLRLCYAGDVLRVQGGQIRPERQFVQAGAELIGITGPGADAEVILTALEALDVLEIPNLTLDLGLPTLVPTLLKAFDVAADMDVHKPLRLALDRKDPSAVEELSDALPAPLVILLTKLIRATGPAENTIASISELNLPAAAAMLWNDLAATHKLLSKTRDIAITCDPVEHRGFEYHAGLTFTIFSRGVRGELGGGGRYFTQTADQSPEGEPATGFSLFLDSLLRALPRPERPERLFLPHGTDAGLAKRLRDDGWRTVSGLSARDNPQEAARESACTHILSGGEPREL